MADTILKEVISGNVTWNDFVSWLKPKKESEQEIPFKVSCKVNQGDFVIYFVNLLHDEVNSVLQKSSGGNYSVKQPTNLSVLEKKKHLFNARNARLGNSPNDQSASHFLKQNGAANGNVNKISVINCESKQDSSVFNKSLDNNNKNFLRCYSLLNGTVKSNNDIQNSSSKRQNTTISPVQKSSEGTFLHSCHLSPIATELYSSRKEKHSMLGCEIDSPNNRTVRKDRSGCNKRVPNERSTSSPCSSTFNLAEHTFPTVGSPAKQNSSRRRRIKPTRLVDTFEKGKVVDQNRAPNFGEVVRPLEPSVPFREDVIIKERKGSPEDDFRDLLRLEKQKLQQNAHNNTVTPKSPQPVTIVSASPELVKFRDELCVLANIYNLLLDTNLVCSIVSEIHFIISLLNVLEDSETSCLELKETAHLGYFVSVHECVFFATTVLNQQRLFLSTFDKATLKLLLNNKRISNFVPDLWKFLSDLYQTRSDTRTSIGSSAFHSSVCFQSDTDNRENFPNDRTFVTFRKQRDAFYEILGLWEENHSLPGWSFGVAIGPRVRNLLCMNDEPANFIHFARLFRTQLLGSCWKSSDSAVEEECNGALAEVLKCLKEGNPDKYSRLHERLVTPIKTSNSCTVTDFPDQQEFYKDFIVCGCHAVFNAHLVDSFWHEIVLLNSSNFTASEVEEDTTVDKDTKEAFIVCVRNLQLLAKFLGFVLFLPYRSNTKIPNHLIEKQISLRLKSNPQIDLLAYVKEATQSKKLTLTIPWVIQFLSMVDSVSYSMSYYREVISLLFGIYETLSSSIPTPYGSFMLKVCLGWLFERPQLPEDLFYNWCLNGNQKCDFIVNAENSRSMTAGIDELELIEWDTLQILCPHLETIKWLLVSDTNNVRNVLPPRHITPVLVAPEQATSSSSTQNIELALEENFLDGQPPSLRKTIEFVSERIASSCVKYICGKPLLEVKEKSIKMLERSIESDAKGNSLTKVPLETLLACELKKNCLAIIPKLCFEKCGSIMPSLLTEDVPEEVTKVCVKIAVRMCLERVNIWINSHITPALFSKHLSSEIDKICRNTRKSLKVSHVLSCGWRDTLEDDAIAPAESIIRIRKLILKVMEDPKVQEEDIVTVLDTILNTLQSRRDLIPSAERVIGAVSIDLAFTLLAHQPELMKENMLNKFLSVWTTKEVTTSHCFQHMICPRNIMILNHSLNAEETWLATAQFLFFVLKNNIVSPSEFESQCVAVFRQEWPKGTLKHLASCFEDVVKLYQHGSCDANFVLLLEFVSDLCRDMHREDF